jgi:peptidoglycan/xylan/chitin deacetylase (PgdA/CDA1 family)
MRSAVIKELIVTVAPAPARVVIPRFPGNKRIAVTTSWDDGLVFDRPVVEAFNRWGIKGTFNLNSGILGRTGKPTPIEAKQRIDACEVAELYAGHEVAVHSATHPSATLVSLAEFAQEIIDDRKALEDLVCYPVRGMAYPNGAYNAEVIALLRQLGIVYARTTEAVPNCFPVAEPLAWPATMHWQASNPSPMPQRWNECYNNSRWSGVFFIWGHSYEFDRGDCWDKLESYFAPLGGKSDVWYCTNIELWDYHYARSRLVVAANKRTAYNPSAIPVSVSIGGKVMDIPPGKVTPLV